MIFSVKNKQSSIVTYLNTLLIMRMCRENGIVNVLMYTHKTNLKLPFEEFSQKAQMVPLQTSSSASAPGSSLTQALARLEAGTQLSWCLSTNQNEISRIYIHKTNCKHIPTNLFNKFYRHEKRFFFFFCNLGTSLHLMNLTSFLNPYKNAQLIISKCVHHYSLLKM